MTARTASNRFKLMKSFGNLALTIVALCFGTGFPALAVDRPQPQSGPFATPLTDASFDPAAFAEWSGGAERPLKDPNALRQIVWTRNSMSQGGAMLSFGASNQPGARYLRLAFSQPVEVGSVLVRGGDQLSVLRPGAPYPCNLADDSQWIPAQRTADHQITTGEVPADSYALWALPAPVQTRALRFTHVASVSDPSYAGVLGGVYLLSSRFANLAPQAAVLASANASVAPSLINEKYDSWTAWDNGPDFSHSVDAAHPEWIVLSWPHPVTLRGLAALWAGFNAADAEVFTGPPDAALQGAPESEWRPIGQISLSNQYPIQLGIDWLDFGSNITTRAVRLRITQVTNESRHLHLQGKTRNGTRVWLGELVALSPLNAGGLQAALLPVTASGAHPPIPVRFTLATAGYVSLVIDDAQGNRVRNLVSDTWFPAGANTVWWDGSDDLGRDPDAANHGVYFIPTRFVAPGRYTVRGIEHQAIDLHYEFSVYAPGNPPWETADGTGGWLTSHTPASSALFVPAGSAPGGKPLVYLGCHIAEGGSGLAWVDLDGSKQGGRMWVGGSWTAAQFLARDAGSRANPEIYAYAAATTGDKATIATTHQAILRITGLSPHGDKAIANYSFDMGHPLPGQPSGSDLAVPEIGGLAVRDNVAAASFSLLNKVLFIDGTNGKVLGEVPVDNPRGLAFDAQGSLLVLSGKRLMRIHVPSGWTGAVSSPSPQVIVPAGLDDPAGITLDDAGNIYISDRGDSHQVKVFSPAGKLLRSIGHAGAPKAGPYDPLHMNNPRGMTIDSSNHLWVTEESFQPKRVSVWTLDGKLIKAIYGGPQYGGGGSIDPMDKTKFYYNGMEFKLDWTTGTSTITSILELLEPQAKNDIPLPRFGDPASVLVSNGHTYFDNAYLAFATAGAPIVTLFLQTGSTIRLVAAMGRANDWSVLQGDAFKSYWPAGTNPASGQPNGSVLFAWSDVNGNGRVDPDEVSFQKAQIGAVTIMPDLSMIESYLDGNAVRFAPVRLTPEGVPVYDLHAAQAIVKGAQPRASDGGGQVLYAPQETVLTTAPQPFPRDALGGIDAQGHRWSYPSLWPGLHPGHNAPVPSHPGQLIATTRLLGGIIQPPGSDAGPLWGINGNNGDPYLFTADGFYITQLFQDVRTGQPWSMPLAQRNMLLNNVSLHDEDFFPSLTQTPDGKVYVVDGAHTAIVRVDGLNTVHRLPASSLEVTNQDVDQAQSFLKQAEATRQEQLGPKTLEVDLRSGSTPALNNLADFLKTAQWATIDHRSNTIGWGHQTDDAEAAITIAGGRLFAAFRTSEPNLLRNSGAVANAPFKTGGALDLMIGTDAHTDPKRTAAVAGDERLLVYQVNGKTKALLYRPIVPGATNPVPFSSPLRTIMIGAVQDVSDQVELQAMGGSQAGIYALSISLQALSLKPVPGGKIKADIGILRGDGVQTLQRVYWSNKATGIVSDVPSEAELLPNLWGEWVFKAAP